MRKYKSVIAVVFAGLGLMAGSVNAQIVVYEPFVGAPGEAFTSVETESVNLGQWSEPTFTGSDNDGEVIFVDVPAYTDGAETLPTNGIGAALRRDIQSPSAALDAPVIFAVGESVWIGFQGGLRDDGGSNFDRQFSWLQFNFNASDLEVYWDTRTADNALVALELTGATGTTESDEIIPYPPVGDPLNEFVLIRIDFSSGAETIHLWRNPSLAFRPADDEALLTGTKELGTTLSAITARSNAYHTQLMLDEIRIGSTFNDVVGREGPNTSARSPQPAHESRDVARDETALAWTPGELAVSHDVYFGKSFEDVNAATLVSDAFKGNQAGTTYALDRLELETTYYWRIDEVNSPPDSTTFKGKVWSFATEPFAYPIGNIIATASSSAPNQYPENTVNGSGLDAGGLLHGNGSAGTMWISNLAGVQPSWIEYEFDQVYKLHQMQVWNYNETWERMIGVGVKDATIEYSVDGVDYTTLGTTHEFAQGPGAADYAHNTTVDFGGVTASHVRLTANSNWGGGILNQYGLSEIRFSYVPVVAREPFPASGATDVDLDVTLSWRAGREAVQHDVYLGTDEQAVLDGTAGVTAVSRAKHGPLSLDLGQTYFWKVNEVNMAQTPDLWESDTWSFATPEYFVVEDFESFNDLAAEEEGSDLIYLTWIDGFDNPTANGSTMGYTVPFEPSMETDTVHGDRQSAPMMYNNATAALSEVTRTFAAQNWTVHGVQTLSLWFFGDVNNVPGQLYVKVNGAKVAYDGDSDNLRTPTWQPWNIDLASIGVNLQSVASLAIGIEGGSAAGTLLLDDIRLYPYPRELITPVQPDATGLVGSWAFDGDYSDASGNDHNGTPTGAVSFASDPVRGQVLSLPGGDNQFVDLGSVGISGNMPRTIACWAKADSTNIPDWSLIFGFTGQADGTGGAGSHFNIGSLGGPGGVGAHVWGWEETIFSDDEALEWRHYAMTYDGTTIQYYGDGILMDTDIAKSNVQDLSLSADRVYVGSRITHTNSFEGRVDDALIYNRVLSYAEIAGLAGRTGSFDKPF